MSTETTPPPINFPPKVALQWDDTRKVHILTQDGKQKLCPYQNELVPGSKISGVGRDNAALTSKPCNTSCALLKLSTKTNTTSPDMNNGQDYSVNAVVSLGCSGPVSYDLGTVSVVPPGENTTHTLNV